MDLVSLAQSPSRRLGTRGSQLVESSVFPIPPDVLLIPLVLARPDRAWMIAGVCSLASVVGGAFGYFIGWGLFDSRGTSTCLLRHGGEV